MAGVASRRKRLEKSNEWLSGMEEHFYKFCGLVMLYLERERAARISYNLNNLLEM